MKELGLIHRDFLFQNIAAVNPIQSNPKIEAKRDMPLTTVPAPHHSV
jgi:hypothetical protein